MTTRRAWPIAVLFLAASLPASPAVTARAESAPEPAPRYGEPVDLSAWDGATGPVLPPRKSREDTRPAPAGRLVSHDLRTGKTTYTPRDGKAVTAAVMDYVRGTAAGDVTVPTAKNFSAYSLVPDPTLPEYRDKVKLFMQYIAPGDTLSYVASGTLIGPRTVVTAGHCVWCTDRNDWYTKIVVVAAYHDETAPFGWAKSTTLHSWEGWTSSQDWDHDVGVIELDRPVGALTGWEGYGYQTDCGFFQNGDWVHSDYPAESPFDGKTMQTETGRYDYCETFGNEVYYDRPGYRGSSGGGCIRAVDSFPVVWAVRSNDDPILNDSWDCTLTSAKFADIQGWIAAQETPDKDFEPMTATLAANSAVVGQAMPDVSFWLHNNGTGSWQGVVDFDLYLSDNDTISTTDIRLGSYSASVGSIGASQLARQITFTPGTIPASVPGGHYYVGVMVTTPDWDARNNATDGHDAAQINLTCAAVGVPTLLSPADQADCLDTALTFDWTPVDGAAYYTLEIIRSYGGTRDLTAASDSYTVDDLLTVADYAWRVRAHDSCGNGGEWSPYRSFHTRSPAIAQPPALLAPADQDACQPTSGVVLEWDYVSGAYSYSVRLGTACGQGSFYTVETAYELTVGGLAAGTEYFWAVQAINRCGEPGPWSACRSFRTSPAPGAIPASRQPSYDQDNLTVPVLLDWDDAPGADSYWVEYWEDGGSAIGVAADTSGLLLDQLQTGLTYYWRVQARTDCGGVGVWTPTWPFHTIGPGPNLTLAEDAGWAQPVVPRLAPDAALDAVPAPVTLVGDTALTWWNLNGINAGQVGTNFFANHILVDGAYAGAIYMLNTAPGEAFPLVNRGPVTVRGGRHTFEGFVDAGGQVGETDETDNHAAKQWIWQPTYLTPDSSTVRATPPDMTGGQDYLPPYDFRWGNCDGLRVTASGWWNAFTVHEPTGTADYDVGLYLPAADAATGFDWVRTASLRPAGCTDAVLVNTNVTGDRTQEFDVGVFDQAGAGDYELRHVTSSNIPFGTPATIPMAEGEMLFLREVYLSTVDTVGVLLDVTPVAAGVHVGWLDATFQWGGLQDSTGTAVTDSLGHAYLDHVVTTPGFHCVAVYRDAVDGTGPIEVTLRVGPALGDLAVRTPPGWFAPLVPAAGPIFPYPFTTVSQPTTLIGDTLATQYYASVYNLGLAPSGDYGLTVSRDGTVNIDYGFSSLAPGASYLFQGNFLTFPGGLHTISLQLDRDGQVFEVQEGNNAYGRQYTWLPLEQELGVPGYRSEPPDRDGGHATIPAGATIWDNSDGTRTPVLDPAVTGHWVAGTAIVPVNTTADYELRVFRTYDSPGLGFRNPLAKSGTGPGRTEFVLIDQRLATHDQWDVGVVKVAGRGSYLYETVTGPTIGPEPVGDYGPVTMGANELLDVYEAYLTAGVYVFTLHNDSGSVDWGLSVAGIQDPITGKQDVFDDGQTHAIADDGGPGEDEQISVYIAVERHYTLAVWKTGTTEIAKSGDYTLTIDRTGQSGIDDGGDLPKATAIGTIRPNPFNPMTTIAYSLAAPGPVEIGVYDVRGRLVRTLFAGSGRAGESDVVWNGLDNRGRAAVSGIYFVRLRAGDVRETRKISLVR